MRAVVEANRTHLGGDGYSFGPSLRLCGDKLRRLRAAKKKEAASADTGAPFKCVQNVVNVGKKRDGLSKWGKN